MRIAVSSARSPSSPLTAGGMPFADRGHESLDLEHERVALLVAALLERHLARRGRGGLAGGLRTIVSTFCCRSIEM